MFLPFTPLYVLLFLGLTAYAITVYQLFNIKILLTQALVLFTDLVLFAQMFGTESLRARVEDGAVLVCVSIVGFFLVRSVRNEVEQRELIQAQELKLETVNKELGEANQNQQNLIHQYQ